MSVDLLKGVERDLCNLGEELWNVDGPDDVLDRVLERVSLLKAQLKSLQPVANLLRQQPIKKALPNQKATKVKHLIRFAFRKNDRKDSRHKQLRDMDCDALKFCGLSYNTEEMFKLNDAEFDILKRRAADFLRHRNLSRALYRPDIDKAVDSTFEDPEDEGLYRNFMQVHTARRLEFSIRKRKHDEFLETPATATSLPEETEPPKPKEKLDQAKYGDVFAISVEDARFALSFDEHIGSIYLTNPKNGRKPGDKDSFLTAWISGELGTDLGKRGKLLGY